MIEMPQSQPSLGSIAPSAPAEGASGDAPTGVFAELLSRNLGHQLVGRFQGSGGESGAFSSDTFSESEGDTAAPGGTASAIGPAMAAATPLPAPPVADRAATVTAEPAAPPVQATIEHVVSQLPPYSVDTSALGPSVTPATTTATGAVIAVQTQTPPATATAPSGSPGVVPGAEAVPVPVAMPPSVPASVPASDPVPDGPATTTTSTAIVKQAVVAPDSGGASRAPAPPPLPLHTPGSGQAPPNNLQGVERPDPGPVDVAHQHAAVRAVDVPPVDDVRQPEAVGNVAPTAANVATSPVAERLQPVPSGLVDRVMQAVEMQRNQPPPRMVVVEVPELDGLRVMVAMQTDGKVHVTPLAGTAPVHVAEPFVAAVTDALTADGFQMADGSDNSDDRRRSGDPANSDETKPRPRRTRRNGRRAGLRL